MVRHPNCADRINLRLDLNPLGLRDTMALIRYRIQVSGGESADRLFSMPAMAAIFLATRGYPRRIIHLCHRTLLTLIIQNRRRAGWRLVRTSARRTAVHRPAHPWQWLAVAGTLVLIAVLVQVPNGWFPKYSLTTAPPPATVAAPSAMETVSGTTPPDAHPTQAPLSAPGWHPAPRASAPDVRDGGPPSVFAAERPAAKPVLNDVETATLTMPARLGRLAIAPNETLGQLIQMIYGRFTPAYLEAIAEANPHIPDPDTLSVGDVIHFPALPAAVRALPVNVWWVQLAAYPRLDEAVEALKRQQRDGNTARLVPYWNPEQGLVFALVLTDCFYDRRVAENILQHTASANEQPAQVRSLWRDDTVFFSNPFRAVPNITATHS
jgi:general secretion pathway protein A